MTDQGQENLDLIQGEIDKINFHNEINGFTVARLRRANGLPVVVTGNFPSLDAGEYVELSGKWITHKTYGLQFQATRKVPVQSRQGLKNYLSSRLVQGIGPKTAQKIVTFFGDQLVDVLDNEPDRLHEVPSIGRKKVKAIVDAWSRNKGNREAELFLFDLEIAPHLITKIIRAYGPEAKEAVATNPYRLSWEIRGIGFTIADKIATKLGVKADSDERIKAALLHALRNAEDRGHCYLTTEQLTNFLTELLKISEDALTLKLNACIGQLNLVHLLFSETRPGKTPIHQLPRLYHAERTIAERLQALSQTPVPNTAAVAETLKAFLKTVEFPLTDEQMSAVKTLVTSRVSVLTGGPGVGKTTTVNTLIRFLKRAGKKIVLCAPTGRAAQRLSEVADVEASTIHRLLEWSPQNGTFVRNLSNPLDANVVVVDESSMLDVEVAASLLSAIAPECQLIFIGDSDQLPSVGAGNFLGDLIASEFVPVSKLTKIFRQAKQSQIIENAHKINSNEMPVFLNSKESDCRFIEIEEPEKIADAVVRLATEILPRQRDFDPVQDIQILTPMNQGMLGTKNLNALLQRAVNPHAKNTDPKDNDIVTFYPLDKVIQTVNDYELGVFNGDIGTIQSAVKSKNKLSVSFGDRLVQIEGEATYSLKLAYAITIHKSQGSEFPVVIIPLSTQHYIMLQRNLIYTALTRAKKLAIFVGSKKALSLAIRNETSNARQTLLKDLLQD
ncbi:MAG: ATP-dependent RecD-like DNA helicase [Oligoflexales bacterium]